MTDYDYNQSDRIPPESFYESRRSRRLPYPPRLNTSLTMILLAINLSGFFLLELSGGSTNIFVLLRYGGKYTPLINQGQIWRLVTPIFLHSGLLHLTMNSFSLYNLGITVEHLFGSQRFIMIYLASGLWGSIAGTLLADPRVVSVGASGAIFGLAGSLFYFGMRYPEAFSRFAGIRFTGIVLLNLIIGFSSPAIDNYAHVGGLFGGFAAAYALGFPGEERYGRKRKLRIAFITALIVAALLTQV